MAEYTINLKAKTSAGGGMKRGAGANTSASPGLEPKISAARDKALKASKESEAGNKGISQLNTHLKTLNANMLKLIESNKNLMNAYKHGSPGGGGGGSPKGTPINTEGGGSVGSSLPYIGAAIAISAFVLQKVNQIGNSYISKAAEQKRSVGIGGFRYGQGMYEASELGSGMKAYATSSGKFANGESGHFVDTTKARPGQGTKEYSRIKQLELKLSRASNPRERSELSQQLAKENSKYAASSKYVEGTGVQVNQDALKIGGIYGLSAEETLGQAGLMSKIGGNYGNMTKTVAGGGIESQLPMIMQAMSSELEEAVRKGVDASSLSKDIAEDMTALTMATKNQDVNTAINIAKSAAGAKGAAGKGQIGSVEEMLVWKGGQKAMLEELNDPKKREGVLKRFEDAGILSKEESAKMRGAKGNIGAKEIGQLLGGPAYAALTKEYITQAGEGKSAQWIGQGAYSTFTQKTMRGSSAGNRQAESIMDSLGGNMDRTGLRAGRDMESQRALISTTKGAEIIEKENKRTVGSVAGIGVSKQNMMDTFVLQYGKPFADATVDMQKALIRLTKATSGAAEEMLKTMEEASKDTRSEKGKAFDKEHPILKYIAAPK